MSLRKTRKEKSAENYIQWCSLDCDEIISLQLEIIRCSSYILTHSGIPLLIQTKTFKESVT